MSHVQPKTAALGSAFRFICTKQPCFWTGSDNRGSGTPFPITCTLHALPFMPVSVRATNPAQESSWLESKSALCFGVVATRRAPFYCRVPRKLLRRTSDVARGRQKEQVPRGAVGEGMKTASRKCFTTITSTKVSLMKFTFLNKPTIAHRNILLLFRLSDCFNIFRCITI